MRCITSLQNVNLHIKIYINSPKNIVFSYVNLYYELYNISYNKLLTLASCDFTFAIAKVSL